MAEMSLVSLIIGELVHALFVGDVAATVIVVRENEFEFRLKDCAASFVLLRTFICFVKICDVLFECVVICEFVVFGCGCFCCG